jgi:hypothetical protein
MSRLHVVYLSACETKSKHQLAILMALVFLVQIQGTRQILHQLTNVIHASHLSVCLSCSVITCKGKGKAIPLQALTGPEGSRSLRLPDFNTLRNGDANLRHLHFLQNNCERQMMQICLLTPLGFYALNYTIHKAYIKWSSGPDLKKTLLYFELMICDKYRGKNTGPQCVKTIGTLRW